MLIDFKYALRMLLKAPGFTIIAVITLAIGIGANTAIFSVVNAVLLKPLPYPAPDQLVAVGAQDTRERSTDLNSLSFPDFADFRSQAKSFQSLAVHRNTNLALTGRGAAQSLRAQEVSGEFFDVLGVKPMLGHGFTRAEEVADEPTGNLHSGEGEEIMELFRKLNNDGMTIVQVTHSEKNASYGKRIVQLRDGWIV